MTLLSEVSLTSQSDLSIRAAGYRSLRGLVWRGLDKPPVRTGLLDAFIASRGLSRNRVEVDYDDCLLIASCQPGFGKGANLIADAIEADVGVFVFGDYDTDGITSTAIWRTICKAYGVRAFSKIPRRSEGYGFSASAAGMPRALDCKLLICVDSGTDRVDEIELARRDGVTTVVVDHHLPKSDGVSDGVSKPHALINGHFSNDTSMRHLCAAGQSYALAMSVLNVLRLRGRPCPGEDLVQAKILQFATIGTVSDMMELVGYNRALVRSGLQAMNEAPVPAIQALLEGGSIRKPVKADGIGFGIGPMINSAGRYSQPEVALDLLLSDDALQHASLVAQLVALNEKRRAEQSAMLDEALDKIDRSQPIAFYAGPSWEKGLVGLVAAGVLQTLHRPALVGALSGELVSGSGRSTDGFDLGHAVIAAHQAGLIVQGGGHAKACGFTCYRDQLQPFLDFITERFLDEQVPVENSVDLVLDPRSVTVAEFSALSVLAPYGQGWTQPRVAIRVRVTDAHLIGKTQETLKLGVGFKAIAFRVSHNGLSELLNAQNRDVILIATPQVGEWQGAYSAEMIIEDAILV